MDGRRIAPAAALLLALVLLAPGVGSATHDVADGRFTDDNGNPHERMIEAIAEDGVTAGCSAGAGRYCPRDRVTRGQMATFLVRAFDLPATSTDRFSDDDGTPHEPSINALAEAGVTSGYPDGTFRPFRYVRRAEMATFLAAVLDLEPIDDDRFTDVSGPHEGNINAVAERGITVGCTSDGTRFCPSDTVRRDAMASFLGRALDLDPVVPAGPVVRASFEGVIPAGHEGLGPDVAIAAGPDRVITITNQSISITDKHGELIDNSTTVDFLGPGGIPDYIADANQVTDPHIVFDPHSDRFFVVEAAGAQHPQDCLRQPCEALQMLAVSKSDRPATLSPADWHLYGLDRTIDVTADASVIANNGGDRDYLAVGHDAVIISSIEFSLDDDSQQGTGVRILDKAALVAGDADPIVADMAGVLGPEGHPGDVLFPAASADGSGTFWLFAPADCGKVGVLRITNVLSDPDVDGRVVATGIPDDRCVRQAGSSPPFASQRGSDTPILPAGVVTSGVYAGGSLWTATIRIIDHADSDAVGIEWTEIDVSSWPDATIGQMALLSEPGVHRYVPAVIADTDGNFAMTYTQSSPDEYPAMYATYRSAGDPPGQLAAPILIKAGEAPASCCLQNFGQGEGFQWADYYGAALDPVDGSMWLGGQYAHDRHEVSRGVWVANLQPAR